MEKIRGGREVRIAVLGYVLPPFVAYAADSGYDCIILDLEHHPMDDSQVLTLLALSHLYDIDIMVRPDSRGGVRLGRFLEDGAAGLLIPRVNSAAEVRDLVEKVKFPPVGDRGMAARSPNLWARFGLEVTGDHELLDGHNSLANHALRETFLILQLETPAGLANLDEMAAVPGFEGFFVGPADLALRMQYEPAERRVNYAETLRRLNAACQRHNLVWGSFPADIAELRDFHDLGARLLLWGVDSGLLRAGLAACAREMDAFTGSSSPGGSS